jgi:hypothetical protein
MCSRRKNFQSRIEGFQESFCHLAAAGIACTKDQDFHALGYYNNE